MAYQPFYATWVDAIYAADGTLEAGSPTPFTAAAAAWWDTALAKASPQSAKGDLVGFDGTAPTVIPTGPVNTCLVPDPSAPSGLRWAADVFVPQAQRGPIGGVLVANYTPTWTPDCGPTGSNNWRMTLTGPVTINSPTSAVGAVGGQMMMLELPASGADRTITLASQIVLSVGTTRTYTVTSGQRAFLGLRLSVNLGAWVLLSQTQTITG